MWRVIAGVVGGFVAWILIATLGNLLLRFALDGYAAAEIAMQFTLTMMVARLGLGALSSVGGGFVAAWIAKGNARAATILGIVLLVVFIPVHYSLWDRFPLWYHLVFLISLLPLALCGARAARSSRPAVS